MKSDTPQNGETCAKCSRLATVTRFASSYLSNDQDEPVDYCAEHDPEAPKAEPCRLCAHHGHGHGPCKAPGCHCGHEGHWTLTHLKGFYP